MERREKQNSDGKRKRNLGPTELVIYSRTRTATILNLSSGQRAAPSMTSWRRHRWTTRSGDGRRITARHRGRCTNHGIPGNIYVYRICPLRIVHRTCWERAAPWHLVLEVRATPRWHVGFSRSRIGRGRSAARVDVGSACEPRSTTNGTKRQVQARPKAVALSRRSEQSVLQELSRQGDRLEPWVHLIPHQIAGGADQISAPAAALKLSLHIDAAAQLEQQQHRIPHEVDLEPARLSAVQLQQRAHLPHAACVRVCCVCATCVQCCVAIPAKPTHQWRSRQKGEVKRGLATSKAGEARRGFIRAHLRLQSRDQSHGQREVERRREQPLGRRAMSRHKRREELQRRVAESVRL